MSEEGLSIRKKAAAAGIELPSPSPNGTTPHPSDGRVTPADDYIPPDPADDPPEMRAACERERQRAAGVVPSEDAAHPGGKGTAAKPAPWPEPKYVTELSGDGSAVDWLWHGCIARGHTTLFSALMKAGKTTLLAHLLGSLQSGTPFAGRATRECRTLIVSEESEAIWMRRRDALGLDGHLSVLCKPMFAKPTLYDWSRFVQYVADRATARCCDLVVFDTLGAFAPWKNENDAAEVQAAMTTLNLLTRAGPAVLNFHHVGKIDSGEGRAARGSTALVGDHY